MQVEAGIFALFMGGGAEPSGGALVKGGAAEGASADSADFRKLLALLGVVDGLGDELTTDGSAPLLPPEMLAVFERVAAKEALKGGEPEALPTDAAGAEPASRMPLVALYGAGGKAPRRAEGAVAPPEAIPVSASSGHKQAGAKAVEGEAIFSADTGDDATNTDGVLKEAVPKRAVQDIPRQHKGAFEAQAATLSAVAGEQPLSKPDPMAEAMGHGYRLNGDGKAGSADGTATVGSGAGGVAIIHTPQDGHRPDRAAPGVDGQKAYVDSLQPQRQQALSAAGAHLDSGGDTSDGDNTPMAEQQGRDSQPHVVTAVRQEQSHFEALKESAALGLKGQPLPTVDELREQLFQKLNGYLSGIELNNGRAEARLVLNPPELGRLHIEIEVVDSKVETRIRVEHAMVRDVLTADVARLKDMFTQQGLSLERYSVDTGGGWTAQREHWGGGTASGGGHDYSHRGLTAGNDRGLDGMPEGAIEDRASKVDGSISLFA